MRTYIVRENVLSDNVLHISDENKVFKGGYIAVLTENTYQNPWADKATTKAFRSKDRLLQYLKKNYTAEEIENVEI